jgi:hypothetical protein
MKTAAYNKQDMELTNANALIKCIIDTYDKKQQQYNAAKDKPSWTPEKFFSAVYRPKVFVGSRKLQDYITTIDHMIELVSDAVKISEVRTYSGHDHQYVHALRLDLSADYVARVPYVKVRHMPDFYMAADRLLIKRMPPKVPGAPRETVLLCREMDPPWSDRPLMGISQQEIEKNYHCITMKINKSDMTLKSWFPGVDKNSEVCSALEDKFVLVGDYYNK